MDITGLILFGRARYQVLKTLFDLRSDEGVHLREAARRAGLSAPATQYELRMLMDAGLVERDDSSGRVLYRIDPSHAAINDLRAVIEKTSADAVGPQGAESGFWTRKRVQQRRDYTSGDLAGKSPFLGNRKLAQEMEPDYASVA